MALETVSTSSFLSRKQQSNSLTSEAIKDMTKIEPAGARLKGSRRYYSNLRDQKESESWKAAAMINPKERLKTIMRSVLGEGIFSADRMQRAA